MVDFPGPYHALLRQPCFVKFMVIPYYACLKPEMPRPHGVLTMASPTPGAYLCELEGVVSVAAMVATADFAQI